MAETIIHENLGESLLYFVKIKKKNSHTLNVSQF